MRIRTVNSMAEIWEAMILYCYKFNKIVLPNFKVQAAKSRYEESLRRLSATRRKLERLKHLEEEQSDLLKTWDSKIIGRLNA